jgi:hypothetical protein
MFISFYLWHRIAVELLFGARISYPRGIYSNDPNTDQRAGKKY